MTIICVYIYIEVIYEVAGRGCAFDSSKNVPTRVRVQVDAWSKLNPEQTAHVNTFIWIMRRS